MGRQSKIIIADLAASRGRHLCHNKVIPFNCIAHPFWASFFACSALARARAPWELDRFSMKTEQFRAITGRFLLNELGDPHFLIHKFKWHIVEYNISRFQEKLKILL